MLVGCTREPPPEEADTAIKTEDTPPPDVNVQGTTVAELTPEDRKRMDEKLKVGEDSGPAPKKVKTQVLTKQNDDGTPRTRREVDVFSDGSTKNNGKYEEWYPSGRKFIEGQYVDGLRQGQFKIWHENGKERRIESYVGGKLEGSWTVWRENGTREAEVSYHLNRRDGRWTTYDATGKKPLTQEDYKAGKADGTWIKWFANGQMQSEQHFHDGHREGDQTAWYENGKKQQVQGFKNDLPHGKLIRWKPTGEKATETEYVEGQLVVSSKTAEK